jgi:hypothetical protein
MNPNEIDKRIAIACGWELPNGFPSELWEHPIWGCAHESDLPNYHGDLNAMHEAEKVLGEKRIRSYAFTLAQVLDTSPTVDLDDQFLNIHATAAQRAETFLRTIGQWEDGE